MDRVAIFVSLLLLLATRKFARGGLLCKEGGSNTPISAKTGAMHSCVAQCLDLNVPGKKCNYNQRSGNLEGKCEENFYPPVKKGKHVMCSYSYGMSMTRTDFTEKEREKFRHVFKHLALMCNSLLIMVSDFDVTENTLKPARNIGLFQLELLARARAAGLQLILELGVFTAYPGQIDAQNLGGALTKDANSRAKFLTDILGVVENFKLSGVFFQWLYPGCPQMNCNSKKDKDSIIAMSTDIFRPMREKGLKVYLTVSMDYGHNLFIGDFVSPIMPHVDFFVVETHTQSGPWTGNFDFDNNLSVATDKIGAVGTLIANKSFISKVIYRLKANSFAYEFADVNNRKLKAKTLTDSKLPSTMPFPEYCKLVRNPAVTLVLNPKTQNFGYQGTRAFCFDDYNSLMAKVKAVREKMAGFLVIDLDSDDAGNECGCGTFPYLRTVVEAVRDRECIYTPCF